MTTIHVPDWALIVMGFEMVDELLELAYDGGPSPYLGDAYRAAAKKLHPDAGGDATEFRKLQRAKELLGVA